MAEGNYGMVKVYRYYGYDIISNENISHPTYATMEYIKSSKNIFPLEDSVMEVPQTDIGQDGRYVGNLESVGE